MPEPPRYESLWTATDSPAYPPLDGDRVTDVAIIGGGIVGISAAHLLQQAGRRVTVIESRRVGRQVTGLSSAKVTSQHNLIYAWLARSFGVDAARVYARVNEDALQAIADTASALDISCRFERRSAYTYTLDSSRTAELREEAAVGVRLGLPARFATDTPLPYPVAGAVVFDGQAQFDPFAYVSGLAQRVAAKGVEIFEGTRVTDVRREGSARQVITDRGAVTASQVIVATNLPVLDRGLYYVRAYPIAHSVIAARIEGDGLDGMFISIDQPSRSLRTVRDDEGTLLLVVGPRFTPGTMDTAEEFDVLEMFARRHFDVRSVEYRWTNEDYQSVDGLPYVGRLSRGDSRVFVATGFGGWGITTGVAAARVLADNLAGVATEATALFESTRLTPRQSVRRALPFWFDVAKHTLGGRLKRSPALDVVALAPGDGRVVEVRGRKLAVSRDEQGGVHAVAAECSHRGCVVAWNTGMSTWDCPCHGSIFSADGVVLHGPATRDLEAVPLPESSPAS